MKKIILSLLSMVWFPAIVFGGNPAPYTEEALQGVLKAMADTPKVVKAADMSKEEFHEQFIEYYATVFDKAGYSFNETIDKIVDDMKNDPDAIPGDKQTVYNNIYVLLHILMYECKASSTDCLQYFPVDTQQSIRWFVENSEFSKQDSAVHHGMK